MDSEDPTDEQYRLAGLYKKPLAKATEKCFNAEMAEWVKPKEPDSDGSRDDTNGSTDTSGDGRERFRYIVYWTFRPPTIDHDGVGIVSLFLSLTDFNEESKTKLITTVAAARNSGKSSRVYFGIEPATKTIVGDILTAEEICDHKENLARLVLLELRPSLWEDEFRLNFHSVRDDKGVPLTDVYVGELQIDSTTANVFSTAEGDVYRLERGEPVLSSLNEMREILAKRLENEQKKQMEKLSKEVEDLTELLQLH